MAWGRLDDQANTHGKLLALSDSAWRMWGCGIIYCQNQLTDGFIPAAAIHTFGVKARNKEAVATELCRPQLVNRAPLWSSVPGGYLVHDYLDWNESKTEIVGRRERDAKRKGFRAESGRKSRTTARTPCGISRTHSQYQYAEYRTLCVFARARHAAAPQRDTRLVR